MINTEMHARLADLAVTAMKLDRKEARATSCDPGHDPQAQEKVLR